MFSDIDDISRVTLRCFTTSLKWSSIKWNISDHVFKTLTILKKVLQRPVLFHFSELPVVFVSRACSMFKGPAVYMGPQVSKVTC